MPSSFHSTPAGPGAGQRLGHRRAEPASIGLTPWPTVRVKRARAGGPSRSTAARDPGEAAADGDRAPHLGPGSAGGAGDRGQHHRLERALAQPAPQQADDEPLLVGREPRPAARRTGPRARPDDPVPDRSAARCRTASTSATVTDATAAGGGQHAQVG